MTDTNQLPPHTITIHDHPEPWIMQWSDLELAAVKRYAEQYALQARAILALRPERVPMTPAGRDVIMATRTANADADEWPEPWAYQRGWNDAEAHHGIAAQAKKETP